MANQAPHDVPLLQVLHGSPGGLALAELQASFPMLPRRTLQRQLARLLERGWIRAEGLTRGRRFFAVAAVGRGEIALTAQGDDFPLSGQGRALRSQVTAPIARRIPVGYRRELLDDYRPNQTRYLPPSLCDRLHDLGRSPVGERPAGTYARQVLDRLMIDLSWASSRLEGNTYTRLDTQNLLDFGHAAEGKDLLEAQMILNHKAAIEMLAEDADHTGFDRYTLQNLHALLAENLLDPGVGGRLRRTGVDISHSVYTPTAVPQLIEECFDLLLAKATAIEDPFEQAFFAMVHIPYLQPFDDVNKRVSRLAANLPLIRRNLAPLSFVDLPRDIYIEGTLAVYELNRIELLRDLFAWAYERSCQRYTVLREAVPAPDPLRMRHREALRALVVDVVLAGVPKKDLPRLRDRVEGLVDAPDVDDVVALLVNELNQLHEGNIARYRLRPSQFVAWLGMGVG